MSKKLQRRFDRASNFFKLQPWLEPMNVPTEIARKHGLKEEDRLEDWYHPERRESDIKSKDILKLLNNRLQKTRAGRKPLA